MDKNGNNLTEEEVAMAIEFNKYATAKRKPKKVDPDVILFGFRRAHIQHDWELILKVADRIPKEIIFDPYNGSYMIMMLYDQAVTMVRL